VTEAPGSHRRALNWEAVDVACFKAYEIRPLASQRAVGSLDTVTPTADTTKELIHV